MGLVLWDCRPKTHGFPGSRLQLWDKEGKLMGAWVQHFPAIRVSVVYSVESWKPFGLREGLDLAGREDDHLNKRGRSD